MTAALYGILALLAAVQGSSVPSVPSRAYEEQPADDASRIVTFDVLERMGKCLVNAEPKASMTLLTAARGTPASNQAFDKLQVHLTDCLYIGTERTAFTREIEVQIRGSALIGAVAQALYRIQFGSRPPSSLPTPPSVAPIIPPTSDRGYGELVANYAFAQCLVYAQPDLARRLVLSQIASSEENEALSQLRPFMDRCAYKGTTFKADRNSFRMMLVQSLYRWSITAAAAR